MKKIDSFEGYTIRGPNTNWIILNYPILNGVSACYAVQLEDNKFLVWLNDEFPSKEFLIIDEDEINKLGDLEFKKKIFENIF